MQMNPNEIGKRLGIGVRVAGRIAQQRAEEAARAKSSERDASGPGQGLGQGPDPRPSPVPGPQAATPSLQPPAQPAFTPNYTQKARDFGNTSHKFTRAAGRGMGGFLRPFGRVGGILWLEITGFFFGLFGLYFAQDLWRTRLSYMAGPQHSRFLMAAALTAIFGYLSASAFWRARRK